MKKLSPIEIAALGIWIVFLGGVIIFAVVNWHMVNADQKRKDDLTDTAALLESYYFTHFSFPESHDGLIVDSGADIKWGEAWSPYTAALPVEVASNHPPYCYERTAGGFSLHALVKKPVATGSYRCANKLYDYRIDHVY